MTDRKSKKTFGLAMQETNSHFLENEEKHTKPTKVTFILLENFSMMAFTAAADTLVTANLVATRTLFTYQTIGINNPSVTNDLGMSILTINTIYDLLSQNHDQSDLFIICGGFRCNTEKNVELTKLLRKLRQKKAIIGGLWNGAIHLANAGLLDQHTCAIHPDNHAYIKENFPHVTVSDEAFIADKQLFTCSGPRSTLTMLLVIIEQLYGKSIRRSIEEILNCDHVIEKQHPQFGQIGDKLNFPDKLRTLLKLMATNIEEPLTLEELSQCVNISRRQIERLFRSYLDTAPGRYYLELRITHARRLITQCNKSITHIALACGFSSSSHFSNCYKDYFGMSPNQARKKIDSV
jgi:transcriptional regulator GlxA family with amidase domain